MSRTVTYVPTSIHPSANQALSIAKSLGLSGRIVDDDNGRRYLEFDTPGLGGAFCGRIEIDAATPSVGEDTDD